MSQRNGARGATAFWSWVITAASAVLFAGFIYTVFFAEEYGALFPAIHG